MSEVLILAALGAVAVIAAVLSFIAWYLLADRPPAPADPEDSRFDSDPPSV